MIRSMMSARKVDQSGERGLEKLNFEEDRLNKVISLESRKERYSKSGKY